jgi:uncharacterized protein YqeY
LRKARDPLASKIGFVLNEVVQFGKNQGNRDTTDDEAVKIVRKAISSNADLVKYADDEGVNAIERENELLSTVLPQLVSDSELTMSILVALDSTPKRDKSAIGVVMKALREKYGARLDGKRAGELINLQLK